MIGLAATNKKKEGKKSARLRAEKKDDTHYGSLRLKFECRST